MWRRAFWSFWIRQYSRQELTIAESCLWREATIIFFLPLIRFDIYEWRCRENRHLSWIGYLFQPLMCFSWDWKPLDCGNQFNANLSDIFKDFSVHCKWIVNFYEVNFCKAIVILYAWGFGTIHFYKISFCLLRCFRFLQKFIYKLFCTKSHRKLLPWG